MSVCMHVVLCIRFMPFRLLICVHVAIAPEADMSKKVRLVSLGRLPLFVRPLRHVFQFFGPSSVARALCTGLWVRSECQRPSLTLSSTLSPTSNSLNSLWPRFEISLFKAEQKSGAHCSPGMSERPGKSHFRALIS